MSEFISIRRKTITADTSDRSTLQAKGNSLFVIGILPHGTELQPASIADANAIIDAMNRWKAGQL